MVIEDIKGHLVMIMAPMGSGKGSLIAHILNTFPHVACTISCTTREKRPFEREGKDYYFITRDEFKERVKRGEFIEWAEFSGNLYGTLRSELATRLQAGEVVISEIDIQGVKRLMELIPEEHRTLVYIEAGEWETLKKRALTRAPMSEEELQMRFLRYKEERAFKSVADAVIHNNDGEAEKAKQDIAALMERIIIKIESN